MARERVSRQWCWSASIAMAFVMLVLGGVGSALAFNQQSGGIVPGVATPAEREDESTAEPTPVEENQPGEVKDEEPTPPPATPGPPDSDALAPGTVTVVVWTSDQGPLPERAMVCIGEVCQSVSRGRSGIDLWFDRVEEGWQQIVVRVGAPYGETSAEVQVSPGRNSRVELTLVVTQPVPGEKLDQTPPPVSAEGPLRVPVQALEATSPTLSVSALPSTGISSPSLDRGTLAPLLLVFAGLLVGAATMLRGVPRS